MRYVNTSIQDRFLNYAWLSLDRSCVLIPVGVLTGLSIVSRSGVDVRIKRVSVKDGVLSFVLVKDGVLFAEVATSEENTLVVMTAGEDCVSACVRTGVFKHYDTYLEPEDPIKLRGSLVIEAESPESSSQQVTVDATTVTWESGVSLNIDTTYLTYGVSETTGIVTISLNDDARALFKKVASDVVVQEALPFTTINGVAPDTNGKISIIIRYNGVELPISAVNGALAVISASTASIVARCEAVDYIDAAIAPDVLTGYGYLPLHDAYTDVGGTYIRDYTKLEELTYAPYAGGLTLYERNPLNDPE